MEKKAKEFQQEKVPGRWGDGKNGSRGVGDTGFHLGSEEVTGREEMNGTVQGI